MRTWNHKGRSPQTPPAQFLTSPQRQPCHDVAWLLWFQQLSLLPQRHEPLAVLWVHPTGVRLPYLLLHVGVDDARPHRDGDDIRLFGGERQGDVVERRLRSTVGAPGRISMDAGAGRRQDDAALGAP